MRNVFVATSLADATLIKNLLSEHDIESQTVEKLRGNIGTPYSEVWVSDDAEGDRALQLIRDLHSQSNVGDSWKCSGCGEMNPPSFEICWKCNRERTSDAKP